MPSPVGHILGGLISATLASGVAQPATKSGLDWRYGLFLVFAANAPDLDFVPGMLIGSIGEYHHLASHSLMAAVIFSALVFVVMQRWRSHEARKWAMLAAVAYLSHILLDLFTADYRAPYGMQLFWPFSQDFFIAPFSIFSDIHHGGVGDTLQGTLFLLFSRHNLVAIGLELAILLPVLWLSRKLRRQPKITNQITPS